MKILVMAALVVAGAAQAKEPEPKSTMAQAAAAGYKVPPGYLAGKPPVDILKLLPPPPAPGSAQDIADRTIYATSAQGIDGPAWKAAVAQLNPMAPGFMAQLSCAVGRKISPETTPITIGMIGRTAVDAVTSMDSAKRFYKRPRPFTTDKGHACDPISNDGIGERLGYSYPSGHSALGWIWALVLSDAAPPEKATAIRAFGAETGNLRVACRVHWLSDVAYGRLMAAAVYQRVAAEPEYQADLVKAKKELAAAAPLVCDAAK